jgi:hypothetical protein
MRVPRTHATLWIAQKYQKFEFWVVLMVMYVTGAVMALYAWSTG